MIFNLNKKMIVLSLSFKPRICSLSYNSSALTVTLHTDIGNSLTDVAELWELGKFDTHPNNMTKSL